MEKLFDDNMIIEFTDNNLVKIRTNNRHVSSIKTVQFDEFCNAILAAKETVKANGNKVHNVELTPILPVSRDVYTIQHKKIDDEVDYVIMCRESKPVDMEYYGNVFKNVGVPKLLFAIRVYKHSISSMYCVAVKDDIITEETELYKYPFSNTSYGDGYVCFGNNNISAIKITDLSMLRGIPDMFLAMPNSNHGYSKVNGMDYRPLLESLEGKPFLDEDLITVGSKYGHWVSSLY